MNKFLKKVSVGIRPDLYGITPILHLQMKNTRGLSRHSPRPLWNNFLEKIIKKHFFVSVGIRPDLYGIQILDLEDDDIPCLSRHSPRPLWNT